MPVMNRPDEPDPPESRSARAQRSLGETIDQANRAIEESRAEIARSKALGESVADLARELDRISQEEAPPPGAQEDGA